MSILKINDSFMENIEVPHIDRAFIIHNKYLEKLLFDRGLIGKDFADICYLSSKKFIEHFVDELNDSENLSELQLLSKGFYYKLHEAYGAVTQNNLQINFIATKRITLEENRMEIAIPYYDISALTDTVIIGDTVASGASICAAIDLYTTLHPIKKLYVMSFAGSIIGGQKIAQYCNMKDIDFTIIYSLAAFGLAPNGFDLSFLHKDTICQNKYIDKATKVYEGKPISVVGVDFGTQSQAIKKYKNLCFLEKEYWKVSELVFPEIDSNIDKELIKKEMAAFKL